MSSATMDNDYGQPDDDYVNISAYDLHDYSTVTPYEKLISELDDHLTTITALHAERLQELHDSRQQQQQQQQAVGVVGCTCTYELFRTEVRYQLITYILTAIAPAGPTPDHHICNHYTNTINNTASTAAASAAPSKLHLCHTYLPAKLSHTHQTQSSLTTQLGILSYILLTPHTDASSNTHDMIDEINRNDSATLLSALCMAANNSNCLLPVFTPVDSFSLQQYWGTSVCRHNVRYDCRAASAQPVQLKHVSGMIELMYDLIRRLECRVALPSKQPAPSTLYMSVSYTYNHKISTTHMFDLNHIIWRDAELDHDIAYGARWGCIPDPIESIQLCTSWPFYKENTFVDNPVYSDLDPAAAPDYRFSVQYRQLSLSDCQLSAALQQLQQLTRHAHKLPTLASILSVSTLSALQQKTTLTANDIPDASIHNPGDRRKRLLNIVSTLTNTETSNVLLKAAQQRVQSTVHTLSKQLESVKLQAEQVPSADTIDRLIGDLFDAGNVKADVAPQHVPSPPRNSVLPYGSLLSRFVVQITRLHETDMLNIRSVALIWTELVNELRYCFEANVDVPYLCSSDIPDHNYCILHQKLQMLQHCIVLQRRAHKTRKTTDGGDHADANAEQPENQPANGWDFEMDESELKPSPAQPSATGSGWDELNDLAIDDSTNNAGSMDQADNSGAAGSGKRTSAADSSETAAGLTLLMTGKSMRIPDSQPPVVQTSDQFDAEQQMLHELGSSEEASKLRTELQSKHLISDMSAFKHANPLCTLQDFIRWHSPRDWTPKQGSVLGELSARMRDKTSVWQQLWKSAPSQHVSEQELLFDYSIEAERVLHHFETIAPLQLVQQISQIAVYNTCNVFARIEATQYSLQVQTAIKQLYRYTEYDALDMSAIEAFQQCETMCCRATSLTNCLLDNDYKVLMDQLLTQHACELTSDTQRQHAASLFSKTRSHSNIVSHKFGKPAKSEYTLFVSSMHVNDMLPKPLSCTPMHGHRMYISHSPQEFRLCTAMIEPTG